MQRKIIIFLFILGKYWLFTHKLYNLIEELQQHFGDDLVVLTSHGYISIITFHKNAAHMLKIVKDDDESDHIDKSISILSKQVVQECKSISCD